MRVFHRFLAVLTVVVGFGALQAPAAGATPVCPTGHCNITTPAETCKRVQVVNAPLVNLRASNDFRHKSNVIGVASRGDVYKLRRCKKDGCKVILQTEEGKLGAWIHRDYVSCTRKKRYQQCGLFSVNQSPRYPVSGGSSSGFSFTTGDGKLRLTLTPPGGGHHHHHHHGGGGALPYGNLRVSFNISASIH